MRFNTTSRKDTADLLAVTSDRFQRALRRSFLRYGVTGELDTAVHAAMTVLGPLLDARDCEIVRLRKALARARPPARPRAATSRDRAARSVR